jgi:cytosine/adenosine deaminase-related metal-dependent hydrolase
MSTIVIQNAAIATVDAAGTEYESGHVVVEDGRITAVGSGPAPQAADARVVDGTGCLATPGLVNTHHHLYQWITRGLAQDAALFGWLVELYPIWARLTEDTLGAAARGGLAWLAKTGCTTSADHHYVFPRRGGDLLGAEIDAARQIGLRFHPTRGSMDRGASDGGLPPDEVVERLDDILAASQDAITRYHDPSFDSMLRIGLAPCSPFSVSSDLMVQSASLAREHGVRLHTHLAETLDEERFCLDTHGCTPAEYADKLGWLGPDVWLAHCVHLSDAAIRRFADTGTGHCASSNARLGSGHARVKDLLASGAPVGLGVDGAASQESGMLVEELRQAMYVSRLRALSSDPAESLNARASLRLGTIGGAQVLGRAAEIGSLEVGKLGDVALWRLDGLGHADIADPVCALVLGSPAPLELLLVGGRTVVAGNELRTADVSEVTRANVAASRELAGRACG